VMHVKGQEFPMHEPRIKQALGVGYSLSPTGADHMHNIHDTTMRPSDMDEAHALSLNIPPLAFNDIGPNKMAYYTAQVNWKSVNNCIGLCNFLPYGFDRTVELMKGMTGWNVNLYEMIKVGERMNTLCRAYNLREGITAKDDTLPKRFFQEIGDPRPTTDRLKEDEWAAAKQFHYQAMGWNAEGVPTRIKLQELAAGWVADQIGV
jgi:aldehyde:ferredoxin oxidoreductase